MEGYRGKKIVQGSKIPKPKTSLLCKARSISNISTIQDSQTASSQPLTSMKQNLDRTNSQLENHASEIFSLEEMICEMQEKIETGKPKSSEEFEELKAEKDMLYVQVIELKTEKKIISEKAEKESLISQHQIENLERKIKEMETDLNQLSTEYKQEQLANIARLQEKNLLTSKIETLVSELETTCWRSWLPPYCPSVHCKI